MAKGKTAEDFDHARDLRKSEPRWSDQDQIEKLIAVYRAARGLCGGYDWNRGSVAEVYRNKLIMAVHEVEPLVDMPGRLKTDVPS